MKYLFCFLFLIGTLSIQARGKLQKLTAQLDTASQLVEIDLYNELCDYYEQRNIDSAFFFAEMALHKSRELNYEKGIFKSTCNLGFAYKEQGRYPEALKCLKKSFKYAQEVGDLEFEAQANTFLGATYQDLADLNTALEYYLIALRQRERL